jgi:hypothetical protein
VVNVKASVGVIDKEAHVPMPISDLTHLWLDRPLISASTDLILANGKAPTYTAKDMLWTLNSESLHKGLILGKPKSHTKEPPYMVEATLADWKEPPMWWMEVLKQTYTWTVQPMYGNFYPTLEAAIQGAEDAIQIIIKDGFDAT